MAKQKKTSGNSPKPRKDPLYSQDVLDDLMDLSSTKSFSFAADLLDPQDNAHTYAQWIQQNLPHIFIHPFGPHQQWLLDKIEMAPHSLRGFLAAPRGSGKSALVTVGLPLAMIALGTHFFPVIVGNTQDEAQERLAAIRAELDRNEELTERWPNLRYVLNRGSSRKRRTDTAREIELEGGRILALGAGGKVRGVVRHSVDGALIRPDAIFFDDLDDPEQARSKLRTDRLEEWVFADLSGMGSTSRQLAMVGIGTTIAADCMATRAMNRKGRFKSWTVERFPAIYTDAKGHERPMWPEGLPMPYLKRLTDPDAEEHVGSFTFSREYMLDPKNVTGALWGEELIGDSYHFGELPEMESIILSIDPSWGSSGKGDECGMIVVGRGVNKICYLLEDATIMARPLEWAEHAARTFKQWNADCILAETAFGNEQIKMLFQSVAPTLPLRTIPAVRDKQSRFEPVVVLYEQGKVKHHGFFKQLEDQMVEWVQGESHFSPDRIDAMAHGVRYLMLGAQAAPATITLPGAHRLPAMGDRKRTVGSEVIF